MRVVNWSYVMNTIEKMINAAKNAMTYVMDLKPEDTVLVVTDESTKSIGESFYFAAKESGCTSDLYFLPEFERPLIYVPGEMERMLDNRTVVINVFKALGEETPFRVKWIKRIAATQSIRLGHGPGITESMMVDGPMNVDYDSMLNTAKKLMNAFENAISVRITAPGGTDIKLGIEGRTFSTDVKITTDHFGNLPCGEIWCAPIEHSGEGVIVCDGSIGNIGQVPEPLTITIRKGQILEFKYDDADLKGKIQKLISIDDDARIIGELGVGLNPAATLTGNLLEDEKAFRTAHIAFGNNEDMTGGSNKSQTHLDFLFYNPTFVVTFADGSKRVLIRDGDLQI